MVCDDLLRLGYDRFIMDPGVRTAYKVEDTRLLHVRDDMGLANSTWREVLQAPDLGMPRFRLAPEPQVRFAFVRVLLKLFCHA